jgi:hypothetical protein
MGHFEANVSISSADRSTWTACVGVLLELSPMHPTACLFWSPPVYFGCLNQPSSQGELPPMHALWVSCVHPTFEPGAVLSTRALTWCPKHGYYGPIQPWSCWSDLKCFPQSRRLGVGSWESHRLLVYLLSASTNTLVNTNLGVITSCSCHVNHACPPHTAQSTR